MLSTKVREYVLANGMSIGLTFFPMSCILGPKNLTVKGLMGFTMARPDPWPVKIIKKVFVFQYLVIWETHCLLVCLVRCEDWDGWSYPIWMVVGCSLHKPGAGHTSLSYISRDLLSQVSKFLNYGAQQGTRQGALEVKSIKSLGSKQPYLQTQSTRNSFESSPIQLKVSSAQV